MEKLEKKIKKNEALFNLDEEHIVDENGDGVSVHGEDEGFDIAPN